MNALNLLNSLKILHDYNSKDYRYWTIENRNSPLSPIPAKIENGLAITGNFLFAFFVWGLNFCTYGSVCDISEYFKRKRISFSDAANYSVTAFLFKNYK